jgi:hypothetical protein
MTISLPIVNIPSFFQGNKSKSLQASHPSFPSFFLPSPFYTNLSRTLPRSPLLRPSVRALGPTEGGKDYSFGSYSYSPLSIHPPSLPHLLLRGKVSFSPSGHRRSPKVGWWGVLLRNRTGTPYLRSIHPSCLPVPPRPKGSGLSFARRTPSGGWMEGGLPSLLPTDGPRGRTGP